MDLLSKRYSVLPSDLKEIEPADYQFNMLVASIALKNEEQMAERARRKQNRGRRR